MDTRRAVFLILLFLFVISCATQSSDESSKKKVASSCSEQVFSSNDSGGIFTGEVLTLSPHDQGSLQRILWIYDSKKDTAKFIVRPDLVVSFQEDRLKVGNCVTISYKTEIVDIDGIEVNRFFHATRLDYP